ncbi:MAG TPA: hypothetical protein VIE42_00830 [Steroidobacteraceae bacterium]|jgi:hypothetical protein
MISPNPLSRHTVRSYSERPTPALTSVRHQGRAVAATRDDTAATLELFQNPLWIMAIALGVFCAVAVAIMAFD